MCDDARYPLRTSGSFSSLSNEDCKMGLYTYQTVFLVEYMQATGNVVKELMYFTTFSQKLLGITYLTK
jgi:hypothetical protein